MKALFSQRNPGEKDGPFNDAICNTVFYCLLTGVLFYAAGRMTTPLSFPPSYATAIWPPAGISLAATLLWGYRVLPAVFLAELLIHYETYDITAILGSPSELLVFFLNPLNSAARAWLGCILVKKFADYPNEMISTRLIVLFFLFAGPVATFLPAVLSVLGLLYNEVIIREDLLFAFLTWWLGDCTGIAVFTPLFLIVFDRSTPIWRQRKKAVGLPLMVMFLVTAFAYLFAQQHENRRLQKIIDYRANDIRQILEHQFQRQLAVMNVYKGLAETIQIKEVNFRSISLSIINQLPSASRLIWLEPVNDAADSRFVNSYSVDGNYRRSPDLGSVLQKVTRLDFRSGNSVVTGERDFLIMMPVSEEADHSCECIKGIVAGIFKTDQFVMNSLGKKSLQRVVIRLFNNQNGGKPQPIFQSHGGREFSNPLGLVSRNTVDLGPAKWSLEVSPDDQFLSENYSWSVWLLLAGGMFLTGLTSISILVLTGHTESVRSEVNKRTEELKLSNHKLIASEQQFRRLVQTQSAIVWRADPVTLRFLFVNDEAVILLGYPVKKWLDDPDFLQEHVHKDDVERTISCWNSVIAKPGDQEVEFRIHASDGRVLWLRNFIDVSVDHGKVTELYGFMIDITRQKQAEEQLRLAATTFESQQGIMITDEDARILRVNKTFTEITGYSREQIEGKNPSILKSGHHDQKFYQEFWRQLTANGRFEGEIWNRRVNGEIYPQWQTVTAVKNESGQVSHYVSVFSDITEKKNAENRIHALAFYDPLTGLPNRRLLLDRFEQELAKARRHKKFGAVIFLDLDQFKVLNDTQGHLVGDELLIQVASRLTSVLRNEDTPARLGGDEFVVLLHAEAENVSTVADHTRIVAEKIRDNLNEPFLLHQSPHRLSCSIGIALFPDGLEKPDKILQQADIAMYRSKTKGRNTVSFFHPSMQEATDARLKLEQNLRTAVDQGGFLLYYQPQVDASGKLFGTEALIRWDHPEKGLLLPKHFVPVAEESSIILDIGNWVLKEACRQIKVWQNAGFSPPRVSVNINAHQFRQKEFVDQFRQTFESSGITPGLLGIELTESLMIDDMEETIAKMEALKTMGVAIAVDDFGTGYSSLMYLKQLPIDVLKIDRVFVKDILTNANDTVIIETIIGMAHHLNLRVIAEGVETDRQLDFLKQRRCHGFQGYYFSEPLSALHYADKYFLNTTDPVEPRTHGAVHNPAVGEWLKDEGS